MSYTEFSVIEELTKALAGRKMKISRLSLLHAIAGMLGLDDELKRRTK